MNQSEWDELKLIEARLSEITQRIGELENVQGSIHSMEAENKGTDA